MLIVIRLWTSSGRVAANCSPTCPPQALPSQSTGPAASSFCTRLMTATAACTQASLKSGTTCFRGALAPKDHPSTRTRVRCPRRDSITGLQLRESVNMLCHKTATRGGPGTTRADKLAELGGDSP